MRSGFNTDDRWSTHSLLHGWKPKYGYDCCKGATAAIHIIKEVENLEKDYYNETVREKFVVENLERKIVTTKQC